MNPSDQTAWATKPVAVPSDVPRRSRWTSDFAWLVLLFAAGAAVRFFHLDRSSLIFDEGASVGMARLDWYNFARVLWRREGNMALYYLLLRGWLLFGHSEFYIRALSAILSVLTTGVLYELGRRLFDRRVALIAAALFTFNAYSVRYAQEARSYSLFVLLTTVSALFFVRYLQEGGPYNRTGHVLVSGLSVYAHFHAGLLTIVQWISTRLTGERARLSFRRNWWYIGALVFPAVLFVAVTGAGPIKWVPKPSFRNVYKYYEALAGYGGVPLLLAYLASIGAALAPLGRDLFRRQQAIETWRCQFVLLWLCFPLVFTVPISFLRPLFLARYLIFCLPALLLLAAAGFSRLRSRWLLALAVLVFLGLSARGLRTYFDGDFEAEREDWRSVSHYVVENAQPGDVVFFDNAMGRMPYDYYVSLSPSQKTAPVVIYPGYGDRVDYRELMKKPGPDFIETVPPRYRRVWVVLIYNVTPTGAPDSTTQFTEETFARAYPHRETREFPGIEVRLYSR